MMKKILTKIRLINWHYFVNETVNVSGAFLISGENTAGKSTLLDAIQLVLTTNQRKFNTAANEKSKRHLKGYVRCKTGNEDSAYLRKGSIISYVALEFYEEKTGKSFVLGVKIDSPDEESSLITRWFREEGTLEDLTFLVGNKPATTEEFRKNGRKVPLITQVSEAKSRFAQRMGNLDERFFDMIPKSLAFKPMDNVKDFINKFILAEKSIEVDSLRRNIASLKELEDLLEETKAKILDLDNIIRTNEEVNKHEGEIKINDVLIKKAELEQAKSIIDQNQKRLQHLEIQLQRVERQKEALIFELENERKRLVELKVALGSNEHAKLIESCENRLNELGIHQEQAKREYEKLKKMIENVKEALTTLSKWDRFIVSKEDLQLLLEAEGELQTKTNIVYKLDQDLKSLQAEFQENLYTHQTQLKKCHEESQGLEIEIKALRNKKMIFPAGTVRLKSEIEKEFARNGIKQPVYIFSELLDITDVKWQNAVEGYLNTQRFNIIVEPQYYRQALDVYHRIRHEVHTVGLVNTGKLHLEVETDPTSLAYVVTSDNRYAKAYSQFLMNRVIRCDDVQELKEHKVAITAECMLYKSLAVRKIDERVYQTPYIGARAIEIQLKNKESRLAQVKGLAIDLQQEVKKIETLLNRLNVCHMNTLSENLDSPFNLQENEKNIAREMVELKKAKDNPNFIELQMQVEECEKATKKLDNENERLTQDIANLKNDMYQTSNRIESVTKEVELHEDALNNLISEDETVAAQGLEKYQDQIKAKDPATIVANFSPRRQSLINKRNEVANTLVERQLQYCKAYEVDLNHGVRYMQEYVDEHFKLHASELVKFEEELKKAKDNCHLEFRESFLARLKEYIETAHMEFKNLNAALKGVYYGDDSYKFEIVYNKKKEGIYRMIMSKDNVMGFNLWSQSFDDEFKEEMEDLFAKLTAYDDRGEKVLEEYTDYRRYLDYDIIVENKLGQSQRFSKIYGEKSGGETQTPFYVAIAASFAQLYKLGDTIRIIMFDEAFDKMDDNRIASMMDFLNHQGFQIILATPPAKVEVIGEKVDTILMAMREGVTSIIEEYDL